MKIEGSNVYVVFDISLLGSLVINRYCVVNDGGELQLQLIHLHLRHLPRQRHPDDPHDPLMRLLEIHVNNT